MIWEFVWDIGKAGTAFDQNARIRDADIRLCLAGFLNCCV